MSDPSGNRARAPSASVVWIDTHTAVVARWHDGQVVLDR
jgi:hypothetical protein